MDKRGVLIGLTVGMLTGFMDSYSYAISGYTTAEISLILLPFLIVSMFKLLGLRYSDNDVVTATAIAYGICITTTLTSGMYITYGFLSYVSSRLKAYGLDVSVPSYLFSGRFPDVDALPIYISLALLSFGGVLIAFTFRNHFIEKERIKYPIGFASAMLTKFLIKASVSQTSAMLAIMLGFTLQLVAMRYTLFLDLTPTISTAIPGAILALSFWPIVVGMLFLIPLDPLKMLSVGSTATYIVLIPIAIALFNIKVAPAIGFEEALFSYSSIVVSLIVGVVVVLILYYMILYSGILYKSLSMMLRLETERTTFILGVAMVAMLGYIAILLKAASHLYLHILLLIFLHVLLTMINLRVVGETGTGSQALLPLVTMYMYMTGVRSVQAYAVLDPFTGIPMPQVVGGSSMNLIRFSRFFKSNVIKVVLYFGLGMFIGSFVTYAYGNILAHLYGFNSQYMPLTRWIPTVVWMSSVYSGKLESSIFNVVVLGLIVGLTLVVLGLKRNILLFPFVVGMTIPPDIGIVSLLVFTLKRFMIKLGPEAHEKLLILSILFLVGCGLAVIFNTLLVALNI